MSQTKRKAPIKLLIISLVLTLAFSFLASVFNTGMFTVDVSRISFDTANGQLSGLLYMPKGASADSPRPTVIVTHGYLNSAEMQDANAIELSRRGYVVLALDMYDHGHSNIKDEAYEAYAPYGAFLSNWAPFWVNSMYDAVQYMYDQPYVLKDEAGNGIIGITGHSMGGFSSTMAVAKDEADFAATGIRKVFANLTEGSDFGYSGIFGVNAEAFNAAGGGRYLGKVAAQYDEFFFGAPDDPAGTVRKKNYVATPDGMMFLQQTAPGEANKWYDTSDGGRRIIYQPAQTHPWNHFSKETTGYAVQFYNHAFQRYADNIKAIDSGNQLWQWKEASECAALVCFVLFLIALALTITTIPGLNKANTGALPVQPKAGAGAVVATVGILLIAILLPAILFETLYGWNPADNMMGMVFAGGLALGVFGFLLGLANFSQEKDGRYLAGGIFALLGGGGLALLSRLGLFADTGIWTAPVVNDVAKWTVGCTFIAVLIMSVVFLGLKARQNIRLADYGVVLSGSAILAGLGSAVLTVAIGYGLLFAVDALFKTDFRIWTFAFKTFDFNICPAVLRYLPTFLAYYIVSSVAICINTNTERLQGWKGYLVAMALNAGGILIWLIRQYATLFATGVAAHPGAALSGIVLVAMVPTLAIAACISRALYKRTGNIWTAAFVNGLLMTIMSVANTTVFYK